MNYAAPMKRPLVHIALVLLSLLVLPAVLGDTLYKWVDAQGNAHYSDKPQPGATKFHVPHAQTYTAPAMAAPATDGKDAQNQSAQQGGYSSFAIASPKPEETFNNIQSVTVSVSLQPGLRKGDQVTITLDDQSQGPARSLSATFDDLERGEHTAGATITQADGQVLTAPSIIFYIQQATKKMHRYRASAL